MVLPLQQNEGSKQIENCRTLHIALIIVIFNGL